MSAAWYAIHSKPHKEEQLAIQLHAHDIEVFYPAITVRPVNPRSKKTRPYFPGYMFVRSDLENVGVSTFQWMPYASGLVEFGGEPAVVPDVLIAALQKHLSTVVQHNSEFDDLKTGDPISIENGIFQGYEAIFDSRISGTNRVRVLLKMLNNRIIPVELEAKRIRKTLKRRL